MNLIPRPALISLSQRRNRFSPAQAIALSFALAIALGTVLLWLPVSHSSGETIGFLPAFFTATSAVCVTGLVVVDTGTAWSRFGQIVIMLLISLGGLGLVTFGTLTALLLGRRVGFGERLRLTTQVSALQIGGVVKLIRNIFLIALGFDLLGAALLYPRFLALHGAGEGAFYALFHSVSAFNNAGFGLYADSLERFVGDPLVNVTIALLFIIGGLGFITQVHLVSHWRRPRAHPLPLHTKIVLSSTFALIVSATLVVLALEWNNPKTLAPLSLAEKLTASFFQGVTPRTAGFNTLATSALTTATALFTLPLMFIGASPGSTGGGIKTVTFFILVGSVWSLVRGQGELDIFGRRIGVELLVRAGVVVTMSVLLVSAALLTLSVLEPEMDLLDLVFETVSAFGTVGLSRGVTADLTPPSQLVIIALLYLGRIGPLTFVIALMQKRREQHISYPAEEVLIG